jgi:succinoglycan biosynthesis protein ExoM
MESAMSLHEVDVFICTYKRSNLTDAVESLRQQKSKNFRFFIHVIDNDEKKSGFPKIEKYSDVIYHHAPSQNISIARNKALDVARKEYLAFMDDDQIASADWLEHLLKAQITQEADIILGPVFASYPEDTADWIKSGDFYTTRPNPRKGKKIETGYTGNVLIRRSCIGETRFKVELGQSGGEDTVFFHELHEKGARISFSPDAVMTEVISRERLTLTWLSRRGIRNGQTYARILHETGKARLLIVSAAIAKISFSLDLAALTLPSAVLWRKHFLRGLFHFGVLSRSLGANNLQNYREKHVSK